MNWQDEGVASCAVVKRGHNKKLSKKAGRGEIVLLREYIECLALKITGAKPSMSMVFDHSRSECHHDLNSQDVRYLLLYMLYQNCHQPCNSVPKPKHFTMQNEPFIRNIVMVHIANARDPIQTLKSFHIPHHQLATIRTGAGDNLSAHSLPAEIMCVPSQEASRFKCTHDPPISSTSPDDSDPGIAPFLLTEGLKQMWGYPVLHAAASPQVPLHAPQASVRAPDSPLANSLTLETDSEIHPAKRLKLDESPLPPSRLHVAIGLHLCPSLPDATLLMNAHRLGTLTARMQGQVINGFSCTDDSHLDASACAPAHVSSMLALDCEMVLGAGGQQLARVSLVNDSHQVVLDLLVLPQEPVIDYLTQYSGITSESFRDPSCVSFYQAHVALLKLISAQTVLVGHSLQNDLRAVRLLHGRCIDTAVAYPHPRGFPLRLKLRVLAQQHLQMNIQMTDKHAGKADSASKNSQSISQSSSSTGHCSIEDATAAMKLAQLKIRRGLDYGLLKVSQGIPMNLLSLPAHFCYRFAPPLPAQFPASFTSDLFYTLGSPDGKSVEVPESLSAEAAISALEADLLSSCSDSRRPEEPRLFLLHITLADDGSDPLSPSSAMEDELMLQQRIPGLPNYLSSLRFASLLIVSAQRPDAPATVLSDQKRVVEACQAAGGVPLASQWTEEKEKLLKSRAREVNHAAIGFSVCSK